MKTLYATLLATAALLTLPLQLQAASESFGDYTVYYQAVNSTFINEDIAQQYGIVRSDRRAFLNVSVMKNGTTAVTAQVSGEKRNLIQQNQHIEFREIREGKAIYYIGEFDFSNAENVRFTLEIQPEDASTSRQINWETRMYNN